MLGNDEVELWYGRVSAEDTRYQACWSILDAAEQMQAAKFKTVLLQQRYVVVHGQLRQILALSLNERPEKIRIAKAEHGKPYLADYPELAFNLSHTEDSWMIALARQCQLGVDIEFCKPRPNLSGLVGRCFSEEEAAYWQQLPEAEKIPAFYRFWTRKEAFVKATGLGIALGLNHCAINPEKPTEFLRVPEICGRADTWFVADVDGEAGLCGALVADKHFSVVKWQSP